MTMIRKSRFTFSDYRLADTVRGRMQDALQKFDINGDGLFQENEIRQALIQILEQDEKQLRYVVQNVFRYDKDNDKAVTYKEFINFSVEQHFGEMAIQRLHKVNTYSQGNKRIMNEKEFIITLDYSLQPIQADGDHESLSRLFSQIDLDRDGFISYQDYFIFLKEYFGSYRTEGSGPVTQPPVKPAAPLDHGAIHRFAKLIYNQLKVQVMLADSKRDLVLDHEEASILLQKLLHNPGDADQVRQIIFENRPQIGYEQFLLHFVPFYFCQYIIHLGFIRQNLNQQAFILSLKQVSSKIVTVVPSDKTLQSLYALFANNSRKSIEDYVQFMASGLSNFQFDRRGLATPR